MPIFDAMETASSSGLSLMKAFFFPSGLTKVLTDFGTTPKMSLKAFLTWTLFALLWMRKVRVLRSVMALLAFSVLSGCTSTEYLSNLAGNLRDAMLLEYLGLEASLRVLGLKKRRLVLTLYLRLRAPFLADLATLAALLTAGALVVITYYFY